MLINGSLPPTGGPGLSAALGFWSSSSRVISTADERVPELDAAAGARIRDLDGGGLAIVTAVSARLFRLATNQ